MPLEHTQNRNRNIKTQELSLVLHC